MNYNTSNLLTQFASNNYGLYNKTLAKLIGLHESIFLGELLSEYDYWKRHDELTEDGYFFSTVANVEEATTLTDYQQRPIVKKLMSLKIIDMKIAGLPAKRYFRIDADVFMNLITEGKPSGTSFTLEQEVTEVDDLLPSDLDTSSKETKELDTKFLDTNNNKYNNNNLIITNENIDINTSINIENLPFTTKVADTKAQAPSGKLEKTRKPSNKEQCFSKTFEIIEDKELADYVNDYFEDQNLGRQLNAGQWGLRLENLRKYATSTEVGKEVVRQTWSRGYRDFYPIATYKGSESISTAPSTAPVTPIVSDEIF